MTLVAMAKAGFDASRGVGLLARREEWLKQASFIKELESQVFRRLKTRDKITILEKKRRARGIMTKYGKARVPENPVLLPLEIPESLDRDDRIDANVVESI